MRQILAADQSESPAFSLFFGGYALLAMPVHAGGTWTLQLQVSGTGVWIDTDVTLDAVDADRFWAFPEVKYRLTGGTPGAEAYCSGVSYL